MNWLPVIAGLAVAATTLFLGMAMTGAGHGWITPFWFSLFGLVLYPATFSRLARYAATSFEANMGLCLFAVFLDYQLYDFTRSEGVRYFHLVGGMAYLWLVLWSLWQIAVVVTALKRGR